MNGGDGVTMRDAVPAGIAKRVIHVLSIVLVFALVGPPLGAFVLFFTVGAIQLLGSDPEGLAWVATFAIIYAVPLSYLFGLMPAAVAGLLIAIWQVFIRPTTWLIAVGVGVIVGVGMLYAGGQVPFAANPTENDFREYPAILVLTCVASTVLCWLIVRNWYAAGAGPARSSS